MIPAYVYAPPYNADPFPVLIWNAYAPSFHPNHQIELRTDPLNYPGLTTGERASFFWYDVYTGSVTTHIVDEIVPGFSLHS